MYNYSNVTVEGFVTHNPVIKKTKTGKSVCNFSVAMNHNSKSDDNSVSFIDVETWEKVADICSSNIHKGKKVMIFGSLRQERWTGKDGKNQSKHKVIGYSIRFLEKFTKSETEFKETEAA